MSGFQNMILSILKVLFFVLKPILRFLKFIFSPAWNVFTIIFEVITEYFGEIKTKPLKLFIVVPACSTLISSLILLFLGHWGWPISFYLAYGFAFLMISEFNEDWSFLKAPLRILSHYLAAFFLGFCAFIYLDALHVEVQLSELEEQYKAGDIEAALKLALVYKNQIHGWYDGKQRKAFARKSRHWIQVHANDEIKELKERFESGDNKAALEIVDKYNNLSQKWSIGDAQHFFKENAQTWVKLYIEKEAIPLRKKFSDGDHTAALELSKLYSEYQNQWTYPKIWLKERSNKWMLSYLEKAAEKGDKDALDKLAEIKKIAEHRRAAKQSRERDLQILKLRRQRREALRRKAEEARKYQEERDQQRRDRQSTMEKLGEFWGKTKKRVVDPSLDKLKEFKDEFDKGAGNVR